MKVKSCPSTCGQHCELQMVCEWEDQSGSLGRLESSQPIKTGGKHLWFIPLKEMLADQVFQGAPSCHEGWFTRNHIQMLQANTKELGDMKRSLISQAPAASVGRHSSPLRCSQSLCLHWSCSGAPALIWLCQHHLLLCAGKEPTRSYLDHLRQFIFQRLDDLAEGSRCVVICSCTSSVRSKQHGDAPPALPQPLLHTM